MKNSLMKSIIFSTALITNCFSQNVGWEVVQANTSVNLNSIFFFDHQFGFACGDSGVVLKSIDSGKTWQSIQSPLTTNLNDCVMAAEDCFTAVGDSASWMNTDDGGIIWSVDYIEGLAEIYSLSFGLSSHFNYSGIYGADSQTIIFGFSSYCGESIIGYESNGLGGFWGTYMLTDRIGFVAGENSISQPIVGRTNNYPLDDWDFVSFYLDGNEGRATGVVFTDSLIGYISAIVWDGRGAISKSTDNGDTWTTKFFSYPLHSISFPISGASQVGYCVGDSGAILKTSNAGENWYNQISPTSERLNKVYFVDQNLGFAVGDNGTILRTTDGGVTFVDDDKTADVPTGFLLDQNSPNPFNPSTTLSFVIGQSSFVSIKIYDVLGNEIAILVNEEKPVGSYEVEFNASNLPSGVYFYRLQVGLFNQIKKMVLIK